MGETVKSPRRLLLVDNNAIEASRRELYRAIARQGGYEVHLMVPETWQEQGEVFTAEPEPDPDLHLHTSPILFGYRQHRVMYRGLVSLLRQLQPALLYVDTEPENYTAAFARWAIGRSSPSTRLALVSSRNLDYRRIGFPYRAAWTHRWCDSWFLRKPADLVFSRPFAGLAFMRPYAAQVHLLPHFVDCTVFSPGRKIQEGIENSPITVGYIGRLVESKGVRLMVDVLPALPENCRMQFMGKGPLRGALERQAEELGVGSRASFQSPVPYAMVPDRLRSMDLLVLPSQESQFWIEQFGRVLIEAMACGVPVVASHSGEIPRTLGPGGVLVPPGDRRALSEALLALVTNPTLRAEIGAAGRTRALENYDAPIVAASFIQAIQSLRLS